MNHVLIIEDEFLIALELQSLLEEMGYESFDMAATEAEAIASAAVRLPTLIVSDVRLAEGNGPDAVTAIQTVSGAVPTIFVTGNPEAIATLALGHLVLTKPIAGAMLLDAINSLKASH